MGASPPTLLRNPQTQTLAVDTLDLLLFTLHWPEGWDHAITTDMSATKLRCYNTKICGKKVMEGSWLEKHARLICWVRKLLRGGSSDKGIYT